MSQMNTRRRSTVHDLAALRLHRDGTRVLNSDTNLSSRRAKYAVRDARGNWIAHDAGGLGNVKQRRSASQMNREDEADADADERESADDVPPTPSRDKGKGRAREDEGSGVDEVLNPRAKKRRRFDEDLNYLGTVPAPVLATPADSENTGLPDGHATLPVPSSDLLKCLHFFASTYYTAMGQLYDGTREARKERKARRLEKLKAATKEARLQRAHSEALVEHDPPHDSGEEEVELGDEDIEDLTDEDAAVAQPGDADAGTDKKSRKKKRPRQVRPMEKDMYKIFDGSALVALGMMLQEHVAETVEPRVPDGWEDEMVRHERKQKAKAKRSRKAKQVRRQAGSVKKAAEKTSEAEEFSAGASEDERRQSDGTESNFTEDEEGEVSAVLSRSNRSLKQNSSVPGLESNDDSDD
ncbi:hypothetical protein BN946_scf184747.g10 [Trametes cinnabarina]|uniref:Uncharacterized protein n=1 Tax=Pycnoporus cinnabarinus TaxID=5643 RepID=A0A060SRM2_PYCCI|nr:hypothetical protein BN946_scf184747.g10 [Trametes cinnabarina]